MAAKPKPRPSARKPKPAGMTTAKSTAAVAATSASPTAATGLCRGCNGTSERAGNENDHHFLQHVPIPFFGRRLHGCGCASTSDASPPSTVLCPCRALRTVAAI